MVSGSGTATTLKRAAGALFRSAGADAEALWAGFGPARAPAVGLHRFDVGRTGERRRIHLRIEADRSGTLFVDAMDVIHLNRTAAEIAHAALAGEAAGRIAARLTRQAEAGKRDAVRGDVARICEMVAQLSASATACVTCAMPEVERAAVFSRRATAPYKADVAVTYGCSNHCAHCYNEPDRLDMASLTADAWKEVLDRLHAVGVPHVIFTGGEATLHPELPELIAHAESHGQITGLNTNGRRLAQASYVERLEAAGLNHVQVTLASSRRKVHNAVNGADAFDQTVRGTERAVASRLHVITNTTLSRANADHAEEIIDYLYALGIRTFAMNGMIYSGGGFADADAIREEELPTLLLRVRDHAAERGMRFLWYTPTEYCRMSPVELEIGAKRCNAGEYSICIEPNGDVLPCQSYYVAAGNILRDPWEQIWRSELFRSFRDREEDPVLGQLPEKCWECPELPVCGGGCRIEREARDGTRVADGGGCGSCGSVSREEGVPVGFVPTGQLIDTAIRSRGRTADEQA